ncbi:MAG: competence/damage-inducible protein A [Anaerolineae bacterium]
MIADHPLQVEICSIGTEIVMGRIQDTNSSWIARRLAGLGAFIRRITAVQDNEDDISDVLRGVLARQPDAVVITGGMGPTEDDLTVACVARELGQLLIVHEETVQRFVERRKLQDRSQLSPGAVKMATVPAGAEVGQNPAGWAPCLHLHHQGTDIFVLPGPPKEMVATFDAHVWPVLAKRAARRTRSLRLAVEMHESEVAPLMHSVMESQHGTYLKAYVALWTAGEGFLPVDIVATAESEEGAEIAAQQALSTFTSLVQEKGRRWRPMDESELA